MERHLEPYTNFHELNLDWVISEMKKAVAAWKESETYWTTAKTAFDEMKKAYEEMSSEYETEWPEFKKKIEDAQKLFEAEITGRFAEFTTDIEADQEAFKTHIEADQEAFKTSTTNAYNAFVDTINESMDNFKESMNNRYDAFTQAEIAAREKLQEDVYEYVNNWFSEQNLPELVASNVHEYLISDEGKAVIQEQLSQLIEGFNQFKQDTEELLLQHNSQISALNDSMGEAQTDIVNLEAAVDQLTPKGNTVKVCFSGITSPVTVTDQEASMETLRSFYGNHITQIEFGDLSNMANYSAVVLTGHANPPTHVPSYRITDHQILFAIGVTKENSINARLLNNIITGAQLSVTNPLLHNFSLEMGNDGRSLSIFIRNGACTFLMQSEYVSLQNSDAKLLLNTNLDPTEINSTAILYNNSTNAIIAMENQTIKRHGSLQDTYVVATFKNIDWHVQAVYGIFLI